MAANMLDDHGGLMDTEDRSQGLTKLAERHLRPDGIEDGREQIDGTPRRPVYRLERALRRACVACLAQAVEAFGECDTELGIHLEEVSRRWLLHDEVVDADHHPRPRLDLLLVAVGGLLDLA